MPTVRELEDLIIDAIYLDVLRGKLDQKEEQFEVEYTMGRDLEPGKLESVLAALKKWWVPNLFTFPLTRSRAETTAAVLTTLDQKIDSISSEATAYKIHRSEQEKVVQQVLKEVMEKQKEKSGSMGGTVRRVLGGIPGFQSGERDRPRDAMDVDEPFEISKGKNRKWVLDFVFNIEIERFARAEAAPGMKPVRKRNRF